MFLKRLEITGFKSFAQKTVFTFPDGIIAIVGPNGSGKSNVIDAVRWLLGEREAKNLRGGKIEDLIFSGTAKKPRMSFARVNMVFDNSDGEAPLEFKEITVSRSIARSGTSHYYINDSEVRLKDIVDFFSKVRLGTKGLSVIGQGAGDIFVKASAQERMTMVQEILGLREYEIKKHHAQRKLSHTVENLEKIEVMMKEVSPRLRMLKKQTSRWEERSNLINKYKELSKDAYVYILRVLQKKERLSREPLEKIDTEIDGLEKEQDSVREKIEVYEQQQNKRTDNKKNQEERRLLTSKLREVEKNIYKIEAQREVVKVEKEKTVALSSTLVAEIKTLLEHILSHAHLEHIEKQAQNIYEKVRGFSEKKEEEKSDHGEQEKIYEQYKIEREEFEKKLQEHEKQEQEQSFALQEFQKQFKEMYERIEEVRKKRDEFLSEREQLHIKIERIHFEKEDILRRIRESNINQEGIEELAKDNSFHTSISSQDMYEEAQREITKLSHELASMGEVDEAVIAEAQEVESHYNHLSHEYDDLSRALEDIRTLIDQLDEKITHEFYSAFKKINEAFSTFFSQMFGGGSARMSVIEKNQEEEEGSSESKLYGIDISVTIPRKKIQSLDMLSGGEKSLVSLAALFALISVSPPPFLVLDEVDSALDEKNSRRFSEMIGVFSKDTQFIIVTHNRVTMEATEALYGVTMDEGGISKVLSLKLSDNAIQELET